MSSSFTPNPISPKAPSATAASESARRGRHALPCTEEIDTPVLLFLPHGQLGDYPALIRELVNRTEATVLFPSARWITSEVEALRCGNLLEFVDLAARLRTLETHPATRIPLPLIP